MLRFKSIQLHLCIVLCFCFLNLSVLSIYANKNSIFSLPNNESLLLDGNIDTTFTPNITPNTNASVFSIATQADGKVIIVGNFTMVDGVSRNGIARLLKNGAIDTSFNPGTGATGIKKVLLQNNYQIIISGDFVEYNGTSIKNIARLNSNGSLDTSFNPGLGPSPEGINDIALFGNKIVVAGGFDTFNGVGRFKLVRLNSNGSVDMDFVPAFLQAQYYSSVEIQQSRVLVGGFVSSSLVFNRLNSDGSVDSTFTQNYTLFPFINDFAIQPDNKILVGGALSIIYNGAFSNQKIIRLNSNGTLDTTFNGTFSGDLAVLNIAIQSDGKIVVGGNFTVSGAPSRIARLNPDRSIDTTFNGGTGIGGSTPIVYDVALQTDGKILLAGGFTLYNGSARNYLIRLGNDSVAPKKTLYDFDYDGKSDISIFRPSNSLWTWINSSDNSVSDTTIFGSNGDKIVPADYDNDGRTDTAVFRPSEGNWYILKSSDSTLQVFNFGLSNDTLTPADYDGDGKADVSVFRSSSSTWYILRSSNSSVLIQQFGLSSDAPVAGDYDGDGKADIAIFRANGVTGTEWWVLKSSNNQIWATQFGIPTDKAVQGDYTGDGKIDVAIWRPSNGYWFILRSEDFSYFAFPFGASGDNPTSGDYDGDGKNDAAVFRSSNLTWYIERSTAGTLTQQFGATGDNPIPNTFVP